MRTACFIQVGVTCIKPTLVPRMTIKAKSSTATISTPKTALCEHWQEPKPAIHEKSRFWRERKAQKDFRKLGHSSLLCLLSCLLLGGNRLTLLQFQGTWKTDWGLLLIKPSRMRGIFCSSILSTISYIQNFVDFLDQKSSTLSILTSSIQGWFNMIKSNLTPFSSTFYFCSIPDNSCPIIGLLIPLSPQHPKPYVTVLNGKALPLPII